MNNYITKNGAGGVGFEPTEVFTLQQFSRPPLSSTQPTTQNRGTALDRMCRTTCSPWDSNPHCANFKSAASANWARRASPPHMRGMCVLAWNRTKGLLIFNQALYQLSYKNLPATNRFLFTAGTVQVFLQTGNLGNRLVTLPSKSLASSSDACQYSGEADILKIRNVRKDVRK